MNSRTQARLDAVRNVRTFALLMLDGWRWLLPQTEVRTLESPLDIDLEARAPHSVGAIGFSGQWWPVYSLTGELQLLSHTPPGRRICLLLDNGADQFGLVCDQVETLTESLRLYPIPLCMAAPDSAIAALALLGDDLAAVTTAEQIARVIATTGERADG